MFSPTVGIYTKNDDISNNNNNYNNECKKGTVRGSMRGRGT
jgi:hypothetical protein